MFEAVLVDNVMQGQMVRLFGHHSHVVFLLAIDLGMYLNQNYEQSLVTTKYIHTDNNIRLRNINIDLVSTTLYYSIVST